MSNGSCSLCGNASGGVVNAFDVPQFRNQFDLSLA
jgi:hypothetical protein